MGRRFSPVQVIWHEGPPAFAFLTERWGFAGPEVVADGLRYTRSVDGLTVQVSSWVYKNEAEFHTSVRCQDDGGGSAVSAALDAIYVECGLGPAQDVPGQSGAHHTISKRVAQHARALQLTMPRLDDPHAIDLLRRCR